MLECFSLSVTAEALLVNPGFLSEGNADILIPTSVPGNWFDERWRWEFCTELSTNTMTMGPLHCLEQNGALEVF